MKKRVKPKWAKNLNKADLQHIADSGNSGKPLLRVLVANKDNPHCLQCRLIAFRAGI